MPSYKNYLTAASLLLLLSGCASSDLNIDKTTKSKDSFKSVETKTYDFENQYIIYALEYENQKQFNKSRELYLGLFEKTNNYEYFLKYLNLSFHLRDYKNITKQVSTNLIKGIKEEEQILRLHVFSLLRLKEKEKALIEAKNLLAISKSDINYELLGTVYLDNTQYRKANDSFQRAYELNKQANTLLSITNIQYYYLNEKKQAREKIEQYIKENGYNYNLSIQLLSFYEREKKTDKLIDFLYAMYDDSKKKNNKVSLLKTKQFLVQYLSRKDINEAIKFLEKTNPEDKMLVNLYQNAKMNKKAYELMDILYTRTGNVDYLAQMAILEFESAKDKTTVLSSVIKKFEKALETLNNPIYQNYLAYLLIDYDKDVNKGLVLVKKALEKEPDNLAYLDTLAWGKYKLKDCSEAYTLMKKIVEAAKDIEDEEIKLHWEKIKECSK